MKRGGLGGAILLAAVAAAIAVLLLDRPAPPARSSAPARAPEEPVPPEPPPVAVEDTRAAEAVVEKPRPAGGSLTLVIRSPDGTEPEATVIVEPFFQQDGFGKREAQAGATIEGLAPEWNRVRVLAPGYAPVFLPVRLHPGGPVEVVVPLTAGATLVGTVRTPDGLAVPGVKVRSVAFGERCSATTDALGAYRVEHLPPGRVEMDAEGVGGQDAAFLELEEGREAAWDPVLRPPHVLSGIVLEENGQPVVGASVSMSWSAVRADGSEEGEGGELETGEDGEFQFEDCRDVEFRVSVHRRGATGGPAAEILATPRNSPVTITLRRGEGHIRGTVVDRTGAPAAHAAIRVWPVGWPDRERRVGAAADGSFRIGPFPPGSYFVELHRDGEPTLHLRPAIEVVAGETRDLGVLRFAAGGRIRVRVLDLSGAVLPDQWIYVRSLDGSISYAGEKDDGAFLSEELAPGSYLALSCCLVEEVPVAAGSVVPVDLRMRPGGTLRFATAFRDGTPCTPLCRIEDARGRALGTYASGGTPYLAEGDYRVVASDGRGRRAEAPVRMGREDQTVVLVLE